MSRGRPGIASPPGAVRTTGPSSADPARSQYVLLLCREKALKGDVQMMMVREPVFHAEMLMQGAFRALVERHRGRIQVVTAKQAARPVVVKHKRRRRK